MSIQFYNDADLAANVRQAMPAIAALEVTPVALTTDLTAITHTAPGTPDYAIQDLINSSAYGFASKDEGNTVLKVILNLQTRVSELEVQLQAAGILT